MSSRRFLGVAEERIVCVGNQRCPLTARGDVLRAEVGHHGTPREVCHDSRLADLKGGATGELGAGASRGKMADRLAMRGDEIDVIRTEAAPVDQLEGRFGEEMAKLEIHAADVDRRSVGREQRENAEPNSRLVPSVTERDQGGLNIVAGTRKRAERGVNAISRRSGHEADHRALLLLCIARDEVHGVRPTSLAPG